MTISEGKLQQINELHKSGLDTTQIASQFDVKEETVSRYLRLNKQPYAPKILLLDIETLPMEVLVWGLYEQRIPSENVLKEWCVVSWSAKWLFDSDIMSAVISPKEACKREDKSIIKKIWALINEADIIIAHNLKQFDIRRLNARFIINNCDPPLPYQMIDTYKESQKNMAFSSHKLDYINQILNNTRKIKTEYNLWKRCAGINTSLEDQKIALQEMEKYNKRDIIALEDLYVALRPWMKSHPNLGLYYKDTDEQHCPNCGSTDLDWKEGGTYQTTVGRFKCFRCNICRAIGRGRVSDLSKKERQLLLSPIAR
jgi:hypothetical protein